MKILAILTLSLAWSSISFAQSTGNTCPPGVHPEACRNPVSPPPEKEEITPSGLSNWLSWSAQSSIYQSNPHDAVDRAEYFYSLPGSNPACQQISADKTDISHFNFVFTFSFGTEVQVKLSAPNDENFMQSTYLENVLGNDGIHIVESTLYANGSRSDTKYGEIKQSIVMREAANTLLSVSVLETDAFGAVVNRIDCQ